MFPVPHEHVDVNIYQQRRMVLVTGKVMSGGRNPDDKTMITDGR